MYMKPVVRKKQSKDATNSKVQHGLSVLENSNGVGTDHLLLQRIGKSRQEILDLMKILKTF